MIKNWLHTVWKSFDNLTAHNNCKQVGVAVSGGGDSIALMSMLSTWCRDKEIQLAAVSVDHGIRWEASSECQLAAALAKKLGIHHQILEWQPTKHGNLQNNARNARYQLIRDWSLSHGIDCVFLAHTMDDQAETLLINLSRGSGVDGLCAMPAEIHRNGICWLRPLLNIRRSQLRDYLQDRQIEWADDPSNIDSKFDRVKVRKLLQQTSELGLTVERLATTASRMQDAKLVLESVADEAATNCAGWTELGEIQFNHQFWTLPQDIKLRLAADALQAVSGSAYRPRIKSLMTALEQAKRTAVTLSGCFIRPIENDGILVMREYAACRNPVAASATWDLRWRLVQSNPPHGVTISSLGASVMEFRSSCGIDADYSQRLMSTPALWKDNKLWASPFVGLRDQWTFEFCYSRAKRNRFIHKC